MLDTSTVVLLTLIGDLLAIQLKQSYVKLVNI